MKKRCVQNPNVSFFYYTSERRVFEQRYLDDGGIDVKAGGGGGDGNLRAGASSAHLDEL